MKQVVIFTDGSCLGNPGPGGWAAILILRGTTYRKEFRGGYRRTTNNRMEILAAIEALSALKEPCEVELFTDSQYLRDAVEKGWINSWRGKGWRRGRDKPLLNVDLWKRLAPLLERHNAVFRWTPGHEGQPENERCDALARACAASPNLPIDEGYENPAPGD